MSSNIIDLKKIFLREMPSSVLEPPINTSDMYLKYTHFFNSSATPIEDNDNTDYQDQQVDLFTINFIVNIAVEKVIQDIRTTLKKKLNDFYFSLLFEFEKEKIIKELLNIFPLNSSQIGLHENILDVLEKKIINLGIRKKIMETILEY